MTLLLYRGTSSEVEARNQFELQALFQSVGVRRPGLTDNPRRFLLKTQPPGSTEAPQFVIQQNRLDTNEKPVVVLDFAGADLAEVHESEFTASGGRNVFRYIDPKAWLDKPGKVLGATQEGTGINARSNPPEPRYGPRSAPGPASEQLIVNENP